MKLYQDRCAEGKEKAERTGVKKTRDDRLTPSPTARELIRLKGRYREIASMREQLVEEIKQRVKDGTYKVQGRQVAEKLINREMVDYLIERGKERM